MEVVKQFMDGGCGCQLYNGGPCSEEFTLDHVLGMRSKCCELSRNDLDMILLGQLMAGMNLSDNVVSESGHRAVSRQYSLTNFSHGGRRVCGGMFRFLHTVGE